jgi:hypothetical protein
MRWASRRILKPGADLHLALFSGSRRIETPIFDAIYREAARWAVRWTILMAIDSAFLRSLRLLFPLLLNGFAYLAAVRVALAVRRWNNCRHCSYL